MRDIKFRAWDNLERRMRKVVSLHWQGNELVSAKLNGDNEPTPIEGRLVIEQFTDLKDRNGKGIYEGDLVIYSGLMYGIKYQLSGFILRASGRRSIYLSMVGYDRDTNGLDCEVIGNVHQISELLEEK